MIGTDLCYGLFEREKKTVQAKNIKFCVGGPSCVGGVKIIYISMMYGHIYIKKSLSSAAPPGHDLYSSDRTRQADSKYMHISV